VQFQLSVQQQLTIRTAKFLQAFAASDNNLIHSLLTTNFDRFITGDEDTPLTVVLQHTAVTQNNLVRYNSAVQLCLATHELLRWIDVRTVVWLVMGLIVVYIVIYANANGVVDD